LRSANGESISGVGYGGLKYADQPEIRTLGNPASANTFFHNYESGSRQVFDLIGAVGSSQQPADPRKGLRKRQQGGGQCSS
jgi:hypothetical protein